MSLKIAHNGSNLKITLLIQMTSNNTRRKSSEDLTSLFFWQEMPSSDIFNSKQIKLVDGGYVGPVAWKNHKSKAMLEVKTVADRFLTLEADRSSLLFQSLY